MNVGNSRISVGCMVSEISSAKVSSAKNNYRHFGSRDQHADDCI